MIRRHLSSASSVGTSPGARVPGARVPGARVPGARHFLRSSRSSVKPTPGSWPPTATPPRSSAPGTGTRPSRPGASRPRCRSWVRRVGAEAPQKDPLSYLPRETLGGGVSTRLISGWIAEVEVAFWELLDGTLDALERLKGGRVALGRGNERASAEGSPRIGWHFSLSPSALFPALFPPCAGRWRCRRM